MADKKQAKPDDAARRARTEARKEKNRQANEAKYRANLEKVKELGLGPRVRDVTRTKTIKKGKKVETKTFTRQKDLSPAELLRAYHREQNEERQRKFFSAQAERIAKLEKLVD